MNRQSITTPDQTVTLKYTQSYIIYNLICFHNYIIAILPYYINFEFTFWFCIICCIPLYTTPILYYSYFQIKYINMILSRMASM